MEAIIKSSCTSFWNSVWLLCYLLLLMFLFPLFCCVSVGLVDFVCGLRSKKKTRFIIHCCEYSSFNVWRRKKNDYFVSYNKNINAVEGCASASELNEKYKATDAFVNEKMSVNFFICQSCDAKGIWKQCNWRSKRFSHRHPD